MTVDNIFALYVIEKALFLYDSTVFPLRPIVYVQLDATHIVEHKPFFISNHGPSMSIQNQRIYVLKIHL